MLLPQLLNQVPHSCKTRRQTIWFEVLSVTWVIPVFWSVAPCNVIVKVKVKCSRYRPGVAQRVGRGIALLFHNRGTRREWVVRSTPRPHFTLGKDTIPILQEAGWAPGPVWTGRISRPHRDSIPDRPARSQSLYRPSSPAHCNVIVFVGNEDGVNRFLTKIGTYFLNKVTSRSTRPTQNVLEVLMFRY